MLLLLLACAEPPCEPVRIAGPAVDGATVRVCGCDEACGEDAGFVSDGSFSLGDLPRGCYVATVTWREDDGEQSCSFEWVSDPIELACGDHAALDWDDGASESVCAR